MNSKCNNCIDSKDSIFSVLTSKEKNILKEGTACVHYKKGENIFKEGFRPSGLISLSKGKVKIFKEGIGGREQIIRLAKSNDFIGFRALFADDYYSASAIAIENSSICVIDKKKLLKFIRQNNELALQIIKVLAKDLGDSERKIISLTQKHLRGRLAESLLLLADTYGLKPDKQTMKVKLAREDLANMSNMTASNAIKTLYSFAEEDVIEIKGKIIKILNREELEKISELG